jgi:SAM-dependent methyltransferase
MIPLTIRRLIPTPLKPPLRWMRDTARRAELNVVTAVRARAYAAGGSRRSNSLLTILAQRVLSDPPPPGSRRVEIGSGWRPQPGYIHIDNDPWAPHLELLALGHRLPLPSDWADEILSIHMIEHVRPPLLLATLQEWHRVLRNGGLLRLHVPDGRSLARALVETEHADERYWAVQNAIYGYWLHPGECTDASRLTAAADHKVLFTWPVIRALLEEVGFKDVDDTTSALPCHHLLDWSPYVERLCLEIEAAKP